MSKIIGRNNWTEEDQALYERGFDDAKFGEVELQSHPSYRKGYEMGLAFKAEFLGKASQVVEDMNRF